MQKKIIALAVAAVASSAAFAQSNVTVYGVADVYAGGLSTNSTKAQVIGSGGLGGSRIGFKGTEDLGGGTSALFTIEYAVAVDGNAGLGANVPNYNPASTTQTRQAFAGLTGAYGTVVAGRLQTLVYNQNALFNPTFGTAADTTQSAQKEANLAIFSQERLDNAIAYIAPKIGDVTLAAAYTTNASGSDVGATGNNVKAYEASATYANGPLTVGGVYRKVNDYVAAATPAAYTAGGTVTTNAAVGGIASGTTLLTGSSTAAVPATATDGNNSYSLGVSYDFGVAKVSALTAQQNNNHDSDHKITGNQFGVVVPVSAAGAVILSQAIVKQSANDKETTSNALLYKHSLSKRTALYGGVGTSKGSNGGKGYELGVQGTANETVTTALVGLNHSF
jgi:GBP family porin